MITTRCQRFFTGQQSWRRGDEPIDTRLYEMRPIPTDTEAKAFVLAHHYAASYPAARRRFGLYYKLGDRLAGVAVFSQPWPHVLRSAGMPFDAAETLELSRFVLLDQVPANGESWFIGQCYHELRAEGFAGVLSFSDPCPREVDGRVLFRGHIGTIYQATNGRYVGLSKGRIIHLLPNGHVLSDRVMTKIRRQEKGWEYGVELLMQHGAPQPRGSLRDWLAKWRDRLTIKLRHPGNYRYVWALQRNLRQHLPQGRAYPKVVLA